MTAAGRVPACSVDDLQDLGLRNATDLAGGFLAWAQAGLPVVTAA